MLPGSASPLVRPPLEAIVIDDFAWPEHILRLEMRGRIRNLQLSVDAVLVQRAGASLRYHGFVPALRQRLHRIGTIEHQLDALCRRSPEAEGNPALLELGA